MSKRGTTRRNTPKEQSLKLHRISKKVSHTGGFPLTQSLYDDNVLVSQKVRKSQERNNPTLSSKKKKDLEN